MKLYAIGLVCLSLLLGGCAVNPVTGESDFAIVSEAEEIKQGRRFHKVIVASYGVYDDPELQRYVDGIGQKLARKSHRRELKYTFTVLDSPEINAFALPGGYIYITRGIMAYLESEAELAGVLGHEIGHVTARHSVRQQSGEFASSVLSVLISATTGSQGLGNLSQTLGTGIIRGYGREHELEADRLGAVYLHRTGYDPDRMLDVIGVLKDQEVYEKKRAKKEGREPRTYHGVFSTHPRNDDRLKTVVRKAKKLSEKKYGDDNQSAYYARIDGMLWGPSAEQGIVRDNRFTHPGLKFALDLPAGWKVINTPEFLQARDAEAGGVLQVGVDKLKKDESLRAMMKRLTRNKDIEIEKLAYGVSAITTLKLRDGSRQPARFSILRLDGRQVLTLLGTATKKQFAAVDRKLRAVVDSFARLDQAQIDAIKLPRLKIVARDAHSFASLARTSVFDEDAESRLRLLNGAFPRGDVKQYARLKTVVYDD